MIKHSLFAAPLLLMSLSVVCQAQPMTRRFVVEFEQKTGSPNQNFSVTPYLHTLSFTFSDIAHTKGYAGSDLSSDEKQGRPNGYELKTTVVESIPWPWLYASHLLVSFELIQTAKNTPLSSTSYSWLPPEMVVAVGWLLKNYWNINLPSFNPIAQKELCQNQPLAAIITIPGSGNARQQCPPPESSGQQAPEATARPTGSSNSFFYSDSAGGSGGSQQHQHTLGLDCFVSPCHGVCQFRPSSDSSGSTEWQMNCAEHSTGDTETAPEQSSCPHLDNGHCSECTGHVTNTDVLTMDGTAHLAVPMDTDAPVESDPCPICLVHFHGRDAVPVVLKTQCCGHHFDLDCISKCFLRQPIGSRRCVVCRQDPMPMVNVNTDEPHPDKFFPDRAFYNACVDGDLDQVRKSLAEGVNVNTVMNNDFTALLLASSQGHKDVVKCLIEAEADLNALSDDGATPLFLAAQEHNTDCVELLINAGADINARTQYGITPLAIAAGRGYTDIVKLLIKARADLDARTSDGATPLFIAAQENNTDCVKLLIDNGADLNARTQDGTTPLLIAAQENNTDCVKLLIGAKADLNAQTKNGATSLFIAALEGHTNIVKLLIKAGADVNARTQNGDTSILIATQKGNTDCVKILIQANADLNVVFPDGTTLLLIAVWENNTDCLQALIEAEADLNAALPNGVTALFVAAAKGNTDGVKLLINAGADLNAASSNGTTPLSIATEMGNTDCVKALSEAGAR